MRAALTAWYRANARDLPWRRTRDPYAVLVSELMLQQQTVRHVTPVFERFLERFPSLRALAGASRADVIRVWQPLGRYASAVRLHAIARQLTAAGGDAVPETIDALQALSGIGRYTAGAIVCFAFGAPAPMVDTNVRRVLGRVFATEAPGAETDDRLAWRLAEAVLPRAGAYDWNQGLMDLGAAVCIARTPRCVACPVSHWCAFRKQAERAAGALASAERKVAESRARYDASSPSTPAPLPVAPAPVALVPAPRFEGSRRWYRGQIMQALCALPDGESLSVAALGRRLTPPDDAAGEGVAGALEEGVARQALLDSLIAALAKDGLLRTLRDPDGALRLALPEG